MRAEFSIRTWFRFSGCILIVLFSHIKDSPDFDKGPASRPGGMLPRVRRVNPSPPRCIRPLDSLCQDVVNGLSEGPGTTTLRMSPRRSLCRRGAFAGRTRVWPQHYRLVKLYNKTVDSRSVVESTRLIQDVSRKSFVGSPARLVFVWCWPLNRRRNRISVARFNEIAQAGDSDSRRPMGLTVVDLCNRFRIGIVRCDAEHSKE